MESAAPSLKRLTLELGGNDAGIVLPDADPKAIAEGLFWGSFINSGQTCACLKRLYVHDSIYDDVCRELTAYASAVPVGDGLLEASALGPVQNRMQFDIVSSYVEEARAKGGRILLGGNPDGGPGFFYPVTLVADVDHGCRLVDNEQFGPALPIIRYHDVAEVVAKANDSPMGLGGSVWGSRSRSGQSGRQPTRMRNGLDQQARGDSAQCSLRRRQTIGLWRRIRRRRAEGIHHGPDSVLLTDRCLTVVKGNLSRGKE